MNTVAFLLALFSSSLFQGPEPQPIPPESIIIPAILLILAFFIAWKYFPREAQKKKSKS